MNRRDMCAALASVAAAIGPYLPAQALAQARVPQAGKDYLRLDKTAPVEAEPGKVEVVEFFWYNCPHCNSFEPKLSSWLSKMPAHVSFRRLPVGFRPDFEPQQRLYYALEAMGLVEQLHGKIFAAIHGQRTNLNSAAAIADWVTQQGVDRSKFTEQFNSFSVATKVRRAIQLQNAYPVSGVPSLGVAGRFYTDAELAGNMDRALNVVDHLVAEVRAGR